MKPPRFMLKECLIFKKKKQKSMELVSSICVLSSEADITIDNI